MGKALPFRRGLHVCESRITTTPLPILMSFGRVFQHISLIDFYDVYRQFTCVSHTIEASLLSAFVLADVTHFAIRLSGYFVPEAPDR